MVLGTNGRFYTLGCDKLPSARGHGEPIRLMIELGNEQDIVQLEVLKGGRKFLVASDAGRGFIVPEDEVARRGPLAAAAEHDAVPLDRAVERLDARPLGGRGGPHERPQRDALVRVDRLDEPAAVAVEALGADDEARPVAQEGRRARREAPSLLGERVLLIRSVDDLKTRLGNVVVLMLVIKFFQQALKQKYASPLDLLYLAIGVLLIGGALYLTHRAAGKEH